MGSRNSEWKWIVSGILIVWGASIGFGVKLNTLLTPGNFSSDIDPSFDISFAAFCFLLTLLGILLLWRGILVRDGRLNEMTLKTVNLATIINVAGLAFVFVVTALLFSANRTFIAQYIPRQLIQPTPDESVAGFPLPAQIQATPTYDPGSQYLGGSIKSALDGMRVGDIWISASLSTRTINYIQVYLNRIECSGQQNGTSMTFAVDPSQLLINGPVSILGSDFFISQDMAAVHGILGSSTDAHGTVYLKYIDPATQRTCDLGNFTWTAALSVRN